MKIEGLSEATLEKFLAHGFLHEFSDLYHLNVHKEAICSMDGFGEKSYDNLIESIEKSRVTTLPNLIYSLGILNIGLSNAKMISRHYDYDFDAMRSASVEELSAIDGVGEVIAKSFVDYFSKESNAKEVDRLLTELTIENPKLDSSNEKINGKTFVITGSLNGYENRNALKDVIEQNGGKVSGSVSAKTDYLINNDVTSSSSKNKKARELNIPIISEEEFQALLES